MAHDDEHENERDDEQNEKHEKEYLRHEVCRTSHLRKAEYASKQSNEQEDERIAEHGNLGLEVSNGATMGWLLVVVS